MCGSRLALVLHGFLGEDSRGWSTAHAKGLHVGLDHETSDFGVAQEGGKGALHVWGPLGHDRLFGVTSWGGHPSMWGTPWALQVRRGLGCGRMNTPFVPLDSSCSIWGGWPVSTANTLVFGPDVRSQYSVACSGAEITLLNTSPGESRISML